MHASPLLLAALAALSTSALAAPSASTAPAAADFSFAQWVEDMIADPAGAHLSPAEAVEAKNAAVAASLSSLRKRINCDKAWARANANDASACLADLARKGAAGTACAMGDDELNVQMCRIGNAKVVGSKPALGRQSVNCGDVARTGGLIFDSCWRSDGTVMGSEVVAANRAMQVNILAP
ncbi:hypothetical protein B5807_09471 [Epicoccum nigrum]|uniref:Ecp2 effector protein domain-containing protein n=1 Tax=Epicoccum nigrum TaxID=105696 RepID=A0A1Y2LP36_EPING|nr:hypothetical protein B5807_09471 [Epicoccum nigrum]